MFLLLALAGINIFVLLGKGTETITHWITLIFGPVLRLFGFATVTTAIQTIETSADAVNIVTDGTVHAMDQLLPESQQPHPPNGKQASSSLSSSTNNATNNNNNTTHPKDKLRNVLQQQYQAGPGPGSGSGSGSDPDPDDARSAIQNRTGKPGWCFIGSDQHGIRTCSEIGVNDTCMSGDIYPTRDVCVNPQLRQ